MEVGCGVCGRAWSGVLCVWGEEEKVGGVGMGMEGGEEVGGGRREGEEGRGAPGSGSEGGGEEG